MVTQNTKPKLTYEDYTRTPEHESWELINGELIKPLSPNEAHQSAQINLGARMFLYTQGIGLGKVYFAPFDVVLSNTDTVRPDLFFVAKERLHIVTVDNIQGAPDLVVEIRSPSTARRDWNVKRELYARHGVKEYWLVDPEATTIAILLLEGVDLKAASVYSGGDELTSRVMGGFSISVAHVFQG